MIERVGKKEVWNENSIRRKSFSQFLFFLLDITRIIIIKC